MRLAILDPVRGFAAITVLTYHCIELFGWQSFPLQWPLVWFRYGWMGVDIFFVLSGLVIGISSFGRLGSGESGSRFFVGFIRRRLFRIAPLYLLTLIAFVVLVGGRAWDFALAKDMAIHSLFMHNLLPQYHGSINGSNWSVGVEVQFYLLFAILASWLLRAKGLVIAVVAILVSWAWRFACLLHFRESFQQSGDTFLMFYSTTQLVGLLDEFALGVLIAKFIYSGYFLRVLSLPRRIKVWLPILACALFVYTMHLYGQFATYWNYAVMVVMFRTLLGVAFASMILALIVVYPRQRLAPSLAPFAYLGFISYGIYLWQLPVILLIKRAYVGLDPGLGLVVAMSATLLVASLTWHFFEKPILSKASL